MRSLLKYNPDLLDIVDDEQRLMNLVSYEKVACWGGSEAMGEGSIPAEQTGTE
jgi:hypothetical protein